MKIPRFITLPPAFFLLAGSLTLHAAEDRKQQNAAYQAGVEQEQLRAQTRRLITDISTMLEEFRKNPAATEEVALTEATLQKLQSLSDKDMAAVVVAMQTASKTSTSTDNTPQILAATKMAKDIQVTLSRLADKLALYQDEASIELRLTALLRRQLTNQRQARYLAQGIIPSGEQTKEAGLTADEQRVIAEESTDLLQSLQRLAANPASSAKAIFSAAYTAGMTGQLGPNAQAASTVAAARDFSGAQVAQQKVVESLQVMLLALSSNKSQEERFRAAEQKMRALAGREKALALTTTKAGLPQLRSVTRRQQEVADQRTILEREVMSLGAETAPLLAQTHQTLGTLDDTFQKSPQVMDRPAERAGVVNTQNGVADQFLAIAEMLKKRGDAAASASGSSEGGADPDRAALTDAATNVLNAINKMTLAEDIINQGGDASAAKEQMDKGKGDLTKAESALGGAPNAAPEGAGKDLDQAKEGLGKGEAQISQGGGDSRTQANASVAGAKDAAKRALTSLRNSLSSMSKSQLMGAMQTGKPSEGNEGTGPGAGWGGLFHHGDENSAYNAVAKVSDQDREALAALQKEKAPPEYDTMARQYMKNLADGVVTAQ